MARPEGVTAAEPLRAILHTDPGCPWAYSAMPALRVMEWRYGDGLEWRLVLIGLAEDGERYIRSGYTPAAMVAGNVEFRDRFGMPFALLQKDRVAGTARACRAVVAARILEPGSEWRALRALQLANFTTRDTLDEPGAIRSALAWAPGLDADAIVAMLDDPAVDDAYARDRTEARSAAGTAAEAQGKTATTDGPVRFTAPSIVFASGDRRLIAGGWQSAEVYDALVANLDPGLDRRPPPDGPEPLLRHFADGLVTQEVAALLARGNDAIDRPAAEQALLHLVGEGRAERIPLGQDALWRAVT